ncbi:MAG: VPLPA-CTERM sorting domain-containing protein [Paracoccaceae bacterium]
MKRFGLAAVAALVAGTAQAATIYSEDFTGQLGKGRTKDFDQVLFDTFTDADGPRGRVVSVPIVEDLNGVDWTLGGVPLLQGKNACLSEADIGCVAGTFSVIDDTYRTSSLNQNFNLNGPSGNEFLAANQLQTFGDWLSPIVDISNFTSIELSLDAAEYGSHEAVDGLRVLYQIDDQPFVNVPNSAPLLGNPDNRTFNDDFAPRTLAIDIPDGSTFQLLLNFRNNDHLEVITVDNILLTGTQISSDLELETIPLPPALWLLISGVAAIGFVGRRRS